MAYTARMIFNDFRDSHPELWRRGISYGICGYMTIELKIPEVGRLNYRSDTDTLIWIEHWDTAEDTKLKERKARMSMYDNFCNIVNNYLRQNNVTHQEFADLVGISRQSLSKYLKGDSIPKVSTMRYICKTINYEL